jgi:20S proteasome alpha/beta subunit
MQKKVEGGSHVESLVSPGIPSLPIERRKKYIRPERGQQQAMTIAAAFACQDGVILGADTEVTLAGRGKVYEKKILEINENHGCYLTYCGDTYFVKDLVRRIQETASSCSAEGCLEAVVGGYRSALSDESRKAADQQSWAELIISVRRHTRVGYKSQLFHLHGERVIPIGRYAAIGIGDEFAQAMFAPSYRDAAKMVNGSLALIEALRKVKESVTGCGGETNILCINDHPFNSGTMLGSEFVRQVEEDHKFLEESLRPLYWSFPASEGFEQVDKEIESAVTRLKNRKESAGRLRIPSWL